MRFLIAAFAALALAAPASAATYSGSSTAYASCDGSTTMTASGRTVRTGYAANNFLPLGTWIQMISPKRVQNRRFYRIMDRGGPGFVLDFWTDDCSWMDAWGRRNVKFKVIPQSELYRGRPYKGWKFRKSTKGVRLVWSAR